MVIGIDTSHWNGTVDWRKAKAAGARFAYLKSSQGRGFIDNKFAENSASCNLPWGAYHFFVPEDDAQAQFQNFASVVPAKMQLPPAVDVEVNRNGTSTTTFRTRLKAFLAALEARYGVLPLIYTRASFWDAELGLTGWGGDYPLWVANYGTAAPRLPRDWNDWTIWQYSADGNRKGPEFGVQSADVDLDKCKDGFLPESPWYRRYLRKLLEGRPLA